MSATYTTRTEAIESEIVAALGEHADQHDIDAIADAALEFVDGCDADRDAYILTRQGYRLTVEHDEFWAIVQKHAL